MKIVYSKRFEERYSTNPVESPDRARLPAQALAGREFVEPEPASSEDISRVHSPEHIERVRQKGMLEPALLAAGGACLAAAELALVDGCCDSGRPARPAADGSAASPRSSPPAARASWRCP
ncbi:MAG TPA: hypothetical protein P5049_03915 [Methanothrix sp.]|nr:hypothetical protein [Methanothrix sp.]